MFVPFRPCSRAPDVGFSLEGGIVSTIKRRIMTQ
jgi:hypothetical protein